MIKEVTVKKIEKAIIPDEMIRMLSPLLWDTDYTRLDLQKDKFAIIERIMVYGRPEHIRWMNAQYTEEDLIDVVKTSRNMDKKTANYWAIHFHVPISAVRCFSTP